MNMSAGEKIKILMSRQNMSMGEMAEKTGQSRQNLSNKMKRNDFSESEIAKMAEALGMTVNLQFLDAEGNVVI